MPSNEPRRRYPPAPDCYGGAMRTMSGLSAMFFVGAVFLSPAVDALAAPPYKHVLLISVDGLHALDLAEYSAAHPASTFAALMHDGVVYPNALTTMPSDSFPGLLAQVSGGSPRTTGVFYDDSFDRTYFAPDSNCAGDPGTEVSFAATIDMDPKKLDAGGSPGQSMTRNYPTNIR